jgi:hypothetical protein
MINGESTDDWMDHLPIDAWRATSVARCGARSPGHTFAMIVLRLTCSSFWVDVRMRELNGRWIASADTPDGPSLGLGKGAIEAVEHALEPFEGIVDELLASLSGAELPS